MLSREKKERNTTAGKLNIWPDIFGVISCSYHVMAKVHKFMTYKIYYVRLVQNLHGNFSYVLECYSFLLF